MITMTADWDYIGIYFGLYRDNGKKHGSYNRETYIKVFARLSTWRAEAND